MAIFRAAQFCQALREVRESRRERLRRAPWAFDTSACRRSVVRAILGDRHTSAEVFWMRAAFTMAALALALAIFGGP